MPFGTAIPLADPNAQSRSAPSLSRCLCACLCCGTQTASTVCRPVQTLRLSTSSHIVAAEPVAADDGATARKAAAAAALGAQACEEDSDANAGSTEDSCTASDAKRNTGGSAAAPPDNRPAQAAYEASLRHVTLRLECDGALETRVSM